MQKNKDSLLFAAGKARIPGSKKTVYNHRASARRFVEQLRAEGYGVRHWANVTTKHLAVVARAWLDRGLSVATVKNYLAGVRAVASAYGNTRLETDNAALGIARRVYIDNRDKSVPETAYRAAVEQLAAGSPKERRVALLLLLQRELGLRKEEAFNITARSLLGDERLFLSEGTKGGRDRMLASISERQRTLIERLRTVAGRGNLIPRGMTERQWERYYYKALARAGLTKEECGASGHGLRHAYAQARYEALTGFPCRARFPSLADFQINAHETAGPAWVNLDRDARMVLKSELGHGADRDDVISQYIGASR